MRAHRPGIMLFALAARICAGEGGSAGVMQAAAAHTNGGGTMAITLTSPAFGQGAAIPRKHTGEGADVSPALKWTDPPTNTAAFVLICDDPDAPGGTWVHWVLYDLPPETRSLEENVPKTETAPGLASQGRNSFRRFGYGGPMPPPGRAHRYVFTLYAVSARAGLTRGATKPEVLRAIQGKIIAQAELVGTYKR